VQASPSPASVRLNIGKQRGKMDERLIASAAMPLCRAFSSSAAARS
jgi:hypothetical protein